MTSFFAALFGGGGSSGSGDSSSGVDQYAADAWEGDSGQAAANQAYTFDSPPTPAGVSLNQGVAGATVKPYEDPVAGAQLNADIFHTEMDSGTVAALNAANATMTQGMLTNTSSALGDLAASQQTPQEQPPAATGPQGLAAPWQADQLPPWQSASASSQLPAWQPGQLAPPAPDAPWYRNDTSGQGGTGLLSWRSVGAGAATSTGADASSASGWSGTGGFSNGWTALPGGSGFYGPAETVGASPFGAPAAPLGLAASPWSPSGAADAPALIPPMADQAQVPGQAQSLGQAPAQAIDGAVDQTLTTWGSSGGGATNTGGVWGMPTAAENAAADQNFTAGWDMPTAAQNAAADQNWSPGWDMPTAAENAAADRAAAQAPGGWDMPSQADNNRTDANFSAGWGMPTVADNQQTDAALQ